MQPIHVWYPSPDQRQQAAEFAAKCDDCYGDSGQHDAGKKQRDREIAKLAELAVSSYCRMRGYEIMTDVDFGIYPHAERWHSPDLVILRGGKRWHLSVKARAHQAAERWGVCWTYQYHPRPDPIFSGRTAGRMEVLVRQRQVASLMCYEVVGGYPAAQLLPLMKEPERVNLRAHKRVLYAKDLPIAAVSTTA